ncbi:hypothetical protein [Lujinxingia vulgaris]|uniref:hypothetical protein n=1 Tax=Lujinxingia vulgaris TaxID=2600176 RepID=UPI001E3950D4|nr:hypothetical protein [Lujinxingia vulgaris]
MIEKIGCQAFDHAVEDRVLGSGARRSIMLSKIGYQAFDLEWLGVTSRCQAIAHVVG